MENEFLRRILWAGLLAVVSALASLAASRAAEAIWSRVFKEDPPQ